MKETVIRQKRVLLAIPVLFLIFLLSWTNVSLLAADNIMYPVTIAEVIEGIASVTTDVIDGQAAPGTQITVAIDIPNKESQYNHQFNSVTVSGAGGKDIQTTVILAGKTYRFTMPDEPVTVSVELEICPLYVYVQQSESDTPILVHSYTQEEMEILSIPGLQYYTGLDSMPSVIQGKGIGVLLGTLIDDLKQYNDSVSFQEGSAIKLSSADKYSATFTYKYLLGETRYYYPHLTDSEHNLEDAVEIVPMFAVTSFQARYLTRQTLDSYPMDSTTSYRFCFGLLPLDAANTTVTVNRFAKWINRIDIIESGGNLKDSNISNIKIADTTIIPSPVLITTEPEINQNPKQNTGMNPVIIGGITVAAILIIGSLLYLLWRKKH